MENQDPSPSQKTIASAAKKVVTWYRKNARDLPWRQTDNPYHIWVSEVILQQTTVTQGTAYYLRFLKQYPTMETLAVAPLDDVLKLWEGLGYYSRARNLHASAQVVVEKYNGQFPETHEEILSLKGVGPYAAAAIGSFAFGLPHVVVDGNVLRLVSRFYGITDSIDDTPTKKKIKYIAQRMQDCCDPGEFNQAIMEIGALCCTYKSPQCTTCILRKRCVAYNDKTVDRIPHRTKKIKKRNRYFHYHIVQDKLGHIIIEQRSDKDVWQGLYQFLLYESTSPDHASRLHDVLDIADKKIVKSTSYGPYKQMLTHQKITVTFYHHRLSYAYNKATKTTKKLAKVGELDNYAWPRTIAKFLATESLG